MRHNPVESFVTQSRAAVSTARQGESEDDAMLLVFGFGVLVLVICAFVCVVGVLCFCDYLKIFSEVVLSCLLATFF